MPRSGTTWLSQIFASCPEVRLKFCPLFSYEFKNILDEKSTAKQWEKLFADVYRTQSEFLDQDHLRKDGLIPTFKEKSEKPDHLFIKSTRFHNLVPYILKLKSKIKFIHIVRHPCANIYSWLSNPLEFPQNADPMKEWRTGQCRKTGPGEFWGFNDWILVTRQALRLTEQYPKRHRIIRYEDLILDTEGQTRKLFSYFNLSYGRQTLEFLEQAHSRYDEHRRSVFKRPPINDLWRHKLSAAIISACMDEVRGTELEQFTKS